MKQQNLLKNILLENYDEYLNGVAGANSKVDIENDKEFKSDIKTIFESSSSFEEFKECLLTDEVNTILESEECGSVSTRTMGKVLDRVKDEILTESQEYAGSTEALSFAVSTFPMLVDIYSEPTLANIVTVYPHNQPILTITKIEFVARIIDIDGTEQKFQAPTSSKLIRTKFKTVKLGEADNVFKKLGVAKSKVRIPDRNIRFSGVTLTVDGEDVEHEMFATVDAEGWFTQDVNVIDKDGKPTGQIVGVQGNWKRDSGDVIWSIVTKKAPLDSSKVASNSSISMTFKPQGTGTGIGTTKLDPVQRTIVARCDNSDDFEIEKAEEFIQDWKALWDKDIISDLHDIVKLQIQLNRDAEVAGLLLSNIANAKSFGQYKEFALKDYVTEHNLRPTSYQDVFKNISPILTNLSDVMHKAIKMRPDYLVCGYTMGSILKSIQEFAADLTDSSNTGKVGTVNSKPTITTMKVIVSDAIEDDLIHLVVKNEEYKHATILEVVYKPLFLIKEITNSVSRVFFRTRNWLGIIKAEGIATIKIKDYYTFFADEAPEVIE